MSDQQIHNHNSIHQSFAIPIDIAQWRLDQEFGSYPEGARDKTLLHSPVSTPYPFLRANHRYLFKRSSHRYHEQYWVEILAYRIGLGMGVPVPPAFVAYDSETLQSAALIEWFYSPLTATYTAGGSYFKSMIPDFDGKTGAQHNFETIQLIFTELGIEESVWLEYWVKALTFDALIGNTDRHQDNWGIIIDPALATTNPLQIAPVFDNGTSMGHEIAATKLAGFQQEQRLATYVARGMHHMRWALLDNKRAGHAELLQKIATIYPQSRQIMVNCLKKINDNILAVMIADLVQYDVPVKLSPERAHFMLTLLNFRHKRLLETLY